VQIRAALALACVLTLGAVAPAAAAPAPAPFQVGGAKASIAPLPGVPVYSGGMGFSPPITSVTDDATMEVRAFYVANGSKALAMAAVDVQAWFAASQEGPDYGLTYVREEAARRITARTGIPTTKADIIVQSTHSHAGATLQGIWGPVPVEYLELVRDRTIQALVDAATSARAARLQMGTYDAPWLNNIDIVQTDSYPGWSQDGLLSVLRAVSLDGEPIASFVSVPAHGDIVAGSDIGKLNPDYFGYVRDALDDRLGGLNVVGPATLGRNETPVQVGGIEPSKWFAGVVTSIVGRAAAEGRWLTSNRLASTETIVRVPGTNPALFALNGAWRLPDDQKAQIAEASGKYPINRSMDPPHLTGNVLGADLTALRIADNVFLSMPGEPFPEVRNAIADSVTGADTVVALSKGQDDWGYFYPAWVGTGAARAAVTTESDHHLYNVALQAGDQVIDTHVDNIGALGFGVETLAISEPFTGNRDEQALRPGLQAMASPTWGDADAATGTLRVAFTAVWSDAELGGSPRAGDGKVLVDFGDGTQTRVEPNKRARFFHDYTPGRHTVTLTGEDQNGNVATWRLVVTVYEPLEPEIDVQGRELVARVSGGDGSPLAYRWDFPDGTTAYGPRVEHRAVGGTKLTVTDGTTTRASATIRT
jgi:hypothetical protein